MLVGTHRAGIQLKLSLAEITRMATYESETLRFSYDASLDVQHPTTSLLNLGDRIGISTRQSHSVGDARRTPDGAPLTGQHLYHFWCGDLRTVDQEDITEFLWRVVTDLLPQQEFLHNLAETGGRLCIFVGISSNRCCAHQFDRELLSQLAAIGLDLRMDFYGSDLPQYELDPQARNPP